MDVDATAGTGNDDPAQLDLLRRGLGIDLGGDGVTPNNSVPHTGPNDHQNFPVITPVVTAGGTTTVSGTFNSTPSTTFALDFYTLSSINASGYGEGRYVLGSATLTTDGSGNATFSFAFPTPSRRRPVRDGDGHRSERQHLRILAGVRDRPAADGQDRVHDLTVNEGVPVPFDGTGSTDPDGDPLTYSWTFGDGGTATGAAPTHTYTSVGTDTVTLTVNDGFGGIEHGDGHGHGGRRAAGVRPEFVHCRR